VSRFLIVTVAVAAAVFVAQVVTALGVMAALVVAASKDHEE
jgi:hypothetical protein